MQSIKSLLDKRLAAKGLKQNEMTLFVRDVLRTIGMGRDTDVDALNGQLRLLGWGEGCVDDATLQLIQACYHETLDQV